MSSHHPLMTLTVDINGLGIKTIKEITNYETNIGYKVSHSSSIFGTIRKACLPHFNV